MEAEVLEFRSYEDAANAGLALIRDGNATRSFDTLMRYRSAAMAEFWRALARSRRSRPSRRQAAADGDAARADRPRRSHAVWNRTNPRRVRRPGSTM